MIIKRNNQKRLLFSMIVIFFLILCNFYASASFLTNEKSFIGSINDSNYHFLNNIDDEWFDGNFHGSWGIDKKYLNGNIFGNINLGRSSSIGNIYGIWNTFDESSSGTIQGRFKNGILIGFVKINGDVKSMPFIGRLTYNNTGFEAFIYSLKLDIYYIRGDYEASFLPPLTGPYGVGVKDMHLIDESRFEDFTPDDPDDFREMMIQIWYPVDKEIVKPRVEYMDHLTFAWLKGRSPVPLITIPDNAYLFVRPHGRDEISISKDEKMYPVIIFSHGYDGVYQIYTSLIEDIVSHGFIIVSINHPYISGITVFPDDRIIYVSRDLIGDIGIRSVVGDVKFTLDIIVEMNNSDPNFKGCFDLSKVGMYGHSFGGAATSICCYEDDRFLCGLTLDGVFYIDQIPDGLDKPFCLMLAGNRFNDKNVQEVWNQLNSDGYKVEIIGSTHYGFTDVGVLLNHLVPLIPPNILGFGTIEPKRHVNITRTFELVFFEVYLKGRDVEDLIHLASVFKDVILEYK
jgi:hypothetical protein